MREARGLIIDGNLKRFLMEMLVSLWDGVMCVCQRVCVHEAGARVL